MASKITLTIGADTAKALSQIQEFADSVKSAFSSLAVAAGATFGLNEIKDGFAGVLKAGADLEIMHERTGIATQSLAELNIALQNAHVQGNAFSQIVGQLSRNLMVANDKGSVAGAAIANMGLNIKELLTMNPEDAFRKIAEALSQISNATLRSAYVMDLFGRAGTRMIPVFNQLAKGANDADGSFTTLMSRNAEVFLEIENGFERVKRSGQGLFLGILDQLAPAIKDIVDGLGSIDLTGFGRSIGAFVQVAIDAWKNGQFGEFIGLTIRAGFEAGEEAVNDFLKWSYDAIGTRLGSSDFWTQVWFGFVEAAGKATAIVTKGFLYLSEPFVGFFSWIGETIGALLNNIWEKIKQGFLGVVSWSKDQWNAFASLSPLIPKLGGSNSSYTPTIMPMPSLDNSLTSAANQSMEMAGQVDKYFSDLTESWRKMLGITEKFGTTSTSARDKLKEFIDSKKAARSNQGIEFDFGALDSSSTFTLPVNRLQQAKDAVESVRHSMVDLEAAQVAVQTDWTSTSQEKYAIRKQLLEAEKSELETLIVTLQKQANTPGMDPHEREQILKMIDASKAQANVKSKEIGGLGADPHSFGQQWTLEITKLRHQFGSFAEQTAKAFANVFNNAVSSISSGITGLIMQTKTWGQALSQIGTSILTSVINAIVEMGVRWVMTQVMMSIAGKTILASSVAATAPIAAAQSLIWATPATLSTIASYGLAAASAPGFIAAAEGIVSAESLTGFEAGGLTPNSPTLAWVSERGPEFVVSSHRVTPQTLPILQGIQNGRIGGISGGGGVNHQSVVNLGMFGGESAARSWANSKEGHAWFVDLQNKYARRIVKS